MIFDPTSSVEPPGRSDRISVEMEEINACVRIAAIKPRPRIKHSSRRPPGALSTPFLDAELSP